MQLHPRPRLTEYLVAERVFRDQPVSVVDVGVSGGIEPQWRRYGSDLRVTGFDALEKEVERLNAVETHPGVRYYAALVGSKKFSLPGRGPRDNEFYGRTSSAAALGLLGCDYPTTYFDLTGDGTLTDKHVELDEFFPRVHPASVDFLKIDTDGYDFPILQSAEQLLTRGPVLGTYVEAPLVGKSHPNVSLLAHIEPYLRERGFSIFAIEPHTYTRAALPKAFRWNQPADTHGGQVRWANTLYFRDVAAERYEATWSLDLSAVQLLKLCSFEELYCLEDCAAEILLTFRQRLAPLVDVDLCLDLLTPRLPDGREVTYRQYMALFNQSVEAFYSGN
jgi:Methyltransferase FkbM domain